MLRALGYISLDKLKISRLCSENQTRDLDPSVVGAGKSLGFLPPTTFHCFERTILFINSQLIKTILMILLWPKSTVAKFKFYAQLTLL